MVEGKRVECRVVLGGCLVGKRVKVLPLMVMRLLLAASKADVAGARAALLALQESNQVCRVMQ